MIYEMTLNFAYKTMPEMFISLFTMILKLQSCLFSIVRARSHLKW